VIEREYNPDGPKRHALTTVEATNLAFNFAEAFDACHCYKCGSINVRFAPKATEVMCSRSPGFGS